MGVGQKGTGGPGEIGLPRCCPTASAQCPQPLLTQAGGLCGDSLSLSYLWGSGRARFVSHSAEWPPAYTGLSALVFRVQ